MTPTLSEIAGIRLLAFPPEGPVLASERDAADFIGEAFSARAGMVALPLSRLPSDFLVLSNTLAGHVLQKFVNYGIRVALVGDIAAAAEASTALRDFVRESNRGQWVWFVDSLEALEARLRG